MLAREKTEFVSLPGTSAFVKKAARDTSARNQEHNLLIVLLRLGFKGDFLAHVARRQRRPVTSSVFNSQGGMLRKFEHWFGADPLEARSLRRSPPLLEWQRSAIAACNFIKRRWRGSTFAITNWWHWKLSGNKCGNLSYVWYVYANVWPDIDEDNTFLNYRKK